MRASLVVCCMCVHLPLFKTLSLLLQLVVNKEHECASESDTHSAHLDNHFIPFSYTFHGLSQSLSQPLSAISVLSMWLHLTAMCFTQPATSFLPHTSNSTSIHLNSMSTRSTYLHKQSCPVRLVSCVCGYLRRVQILLLDFCLFVVVVLVSPPTK